MHDDLVNKGGLNDLIMELQIKGAASFAMCDVIKILI